MLYYILYIFIYDYFISYLLYIYIYIYICIFCKYIYIYSYSLRSLNKEAEMQFAETSF